MVVLQPTNTKAYKQKYPNGETLNLSVLIFKQVINMDKLYTKKDFSLIKEAFHVSKVISPSYADFTYNNRFYAIE